jgi:hypothetical protein
MDQIYEFTNQNDDIKFLVSLDNNVSEPTLYSCQEWADLYKELGEHGNDPIIINGDTDFNEDGYPDHLIWNMFAGSTYSSYVMIDHNMVVRYKFNMPNQYDFQYTYLPSLLDDMYGCIDPSACNYEHQAAVDDGSCLYGDQCNPCDDIETQIECMEAQGCMWMGDHCMQASDDCMSYNNQFDCMEDDECYWMGNHCMSGSTCTDPLAFNYNPIADAIGDYDTSDCQYSSFLKFGCTYEGAVNFDQDANVDDGSCEYLNEDLNSDGTVDILDIIEMVNFIMGNK